jgi:Flp pilus assembly pilin Flp
MATVFATAWDFVRREEGVSLVEYTLTLLFLVIITVALLSALGGAVTDFFNSLGSSL